MPALDAVMFLSPRNSSSTSSSPSAAYAQARPGKKLGYIILPIGVPAGMDAGRRSTTTRGTTPSGRSSRLCARTTSASTRWSTGSTSASRTDDKLNVIGVGGRRQRIGDQSETGNTPSTLVFPDLDQWRDAIYAKIVQKVGERRYWEDWAKDVAGIAADHITRITALLEGSDADAARRVRRASSTGCAATSTTASREHDAIEMLAQHLITRPVFDALFEGYAFRDHNPVSQIDAAHARRARRAPPRDGDRDAPQVLRLRPHACRRHRRTPTGKQQISTSSTTRSSSTAFTKTADKLGIVYTPDRDRRLHHPLRRRRSCKPSSVPSLSDEGVHVLDPFTGTGTFIVRLLQSGLIKPDDLARKYAAGAARQRDPAARLLHRRRQHRDDLPRLSPDGDRTCRSKASCSPTLSR